MKTESSENYLKAIYELVEEAGLEWASTGALAEELGVTAPSITAMLKRLATEEPPLIVYEPYHGARLTADGQLAALEVVRHHRLLECFLSAALGYGWDEVHEEAHRLEHAISEEMEERVAAFLGQPDVDPHGSPIPRRDGSVAATDDVRLSDLPPGRPARVCRVSDHDPALLRYLQELGLTLGTSVVIAAKDPFDGPYHLNLSEHAAEYALGRGVIDHVYVKPIDG